MGIWHTLRAQKGSHVPISRPKYIPYSYVERLGKHLTFPKADRSRFTETKVSEERISCHCDTRLQMIIDEIGSIRNQIEEN